jgi:hypothetical protein
VAVALGTVDPDLIELFLCLTNHCITLSTNILHYLQTYSSFGPHLSYLGLPKASSSLDLVKDIADLTITSDLDLPAGLRVWTLHAGLLPLGRGLFDSIW